MNQRAARGTGGALVLIACLAAPAVWAQAANKRVCVEVVQVDETAPVTQSDTPSEAVPVDEQAAAPAIDPWQLAKSAPPAPRRETSPADDAGFLPLGQTPIVYLKRLLEHFVTHEKNYEAVHDNCQETLRVELYPLTTGWTVFARYSGNGREERIDKLYPYELSQFSERAVLALLADVPISATINRENVLRADSEKSAQRIKGTHHFVLGLGTQPRGGNFDTAVGADAPTEKQVRIFTPMTLSTGYRGKFESWGIEAMAQLGIGTQQTAARNNTLGGNIDFGGTAEIQLHFFHYFNPRGLNSVYLGSGATFELMWFSAIKPASAIGDDRSTLLGGGLDVDLVFGWEFMRASSVQFFLQTELHVPAFALQNQDNYGELHTWFPGLSVKLGVMF